MFNSYNVLILLAIVLLIYLVSFLLVKNNKITQLQYRKFWNSILAISFFVCAILGILLAIILDFNIKNTFFMDILWIHVEFGITMSIVAIIHFFWHFNFYFPKK